MSTPKPVSPSAPPFGQPGACTEASCAKDRIFQAARNLFYKHGIRGVSVDAIAAEAGTTKVTLYRVFSSKDDLIVQCLQDHITRFWQIWDEVVSAHEGDARGQLEAVFGALKTHMCAEEAERGCPIVNTAVEIDDENHPAKHLIREHHGRISSSLRELCKQMGAQRPDELGDALTLLLEGSFASRLVFSSPKQVESVCEAAKALLDSPTLGTPRG
ncbi:MAG TPA: TetR/AcrR family transcriptional regulator [Gammaproteobacteria bacterium]|nr:TetR/AcrR family transcriptional regulator [Gammaproteobacteria bacterium]